ncbi:hypothetical protein BDB01DRAFT_555257 [Pilobolus umbonatus]|nr:hypothetical protein BDB01DRAFT_555257 [Pilobolus umbonatus]
MTTENSVLETSDISPIRSHRNSDRFRSLLGNTSPPPSVPDSPNKEPQRKVFEGEKYDTYLIKNEDRGEWREKVKSTRPLPRYMLPTRSYENRVHSTQEQQNNLKSRAPKGITKRVGTSKIPRYQVTTHINPLEDIRNEMSPQDVYVPMSTRIKHFERQKHGQQKKSTQSQPSSSQKSTDSMASIKKSTSTPHYALDTKSVMNSKKVTKDDSLKRKEQVHAKPFHFATQDRALQYNSFKEKRKLWEGRAREEQVGQRTRKQP